MSAAAAQIAAPMRFSAAAERAAAAMADEERALFLELGAPLRRPAMLVPGPGGAPRRAFPPQAQAGL